MNAQPTILTEALLDELKARWREQGAPIAGQLQPGIDDATMAEITAPLGLTVPSEARTWYRWHNGATETEGRTDAKMGGMGWRFLSLQRSIALVHKHRGLALEAWNGDQTQAKRGFWWTWLPLADNPHGGVMFVDGSAAPDPPKTPVRYTEREFDAAAGTEPRTSRHLVDRGHRHRSIRI